MNMGEAKQDKTYRAFLNAFKRCLENDEDLTQVRVALDSGVSESYISQVVSGKKKAGFKTQVKIADACGYEYIDFLLLLDPRGMLPEPAHDVESKENQRIVAIHKDLVGEFKHKKKGLKANQLLLKIEALDRRAFFRAVADLESLAEELAEKKELEKQQQVQEGAVGTGALGGKNDQAIDTG